ncbi:defensin-like protein 1 [Lathyrus oleraceus]|uniref:defensin-like protein 1 n=1 Tax=Pisum sativum TaxID=3888 RepID=UPI0021CE52BA|nr:defensin-like protein 1 [Pisum sativum]
MERKSLAMFFLLLIAFSSQVVVQTEARLCESQNHGYKSAGLVDNNCALVCMYEGFSGGRCRGFRRRCFYTKLC